MSDNLLDINQLYIEQLLFKKILTDNEYLASLIDIYDKRFFSNKNLSITIDISLAYYKRHGKLPTAQILNMFIQKYCENNNLDYKGLLLDIKNSFDLQIKEDEDFVKETILKFIRNKSVYYTILDNIDKFDKQDSVSDCVEKLQKIVSFSLSSDMGFDYYEQIDKHLKDITNPVAKTSTGFKQLDYVTYGGFPTKGKCLIMFMGQPFVGKSLILSNLAKNYMELNMFPLIISLEMSEEMYGRRIDAHIGKMDVNKLERDVNTLKSRIVDFHKLYPNSKLLIKEYPPLSINSNVISNFIDKLIQVNKKPDVLLVDYITLLNSCSKSKEMNSYQKLANCCKELRALSYKYKIPVISALQTNRQGFDNKDFGFESMAESTGPAQDADFIATLWQEEGDKEAGNLGMTIKKNRFGGFLSKVLKFNINYNTLVLTDKIDENNKEEENINDLTTNLLKDINSK